jgi:hypothetical protein
VTQPNGTPIAVAGVDLFIEPDVTTLAIGEAADLTLVRHTITDNAGCYTLALPDPSVLLGAADSVGRVDLTVLVHRPDRLEFRTIPFTLTTTTVGGDIRLLVARTDTTEISNDLNSVDTSLPALGDFSESFSGVATSGASENVALTDDPDGTTARPDVVSTVVADPTSNALASTGGARWVKVQGLGKRSVVVGQFWSSMAGVRQTWEFGRGASSELGAAWSTSGAAGNFEQGRTWTATTDATVTFPEAIGRVGNYYRTTFTFGLFDFQTYDYQTGRWYYAGTSMRRTGWSRGTAVTSGLAVPRTVQSNCSHYVAGSTDTTVSSRARTWSDGVSLSAEMFHLLTSVKLSSRTGFTQHARNSVTFTNGGWLCGVDGALWNKPGALVARQFN